MTESRRREVLAVAILIAVPSLVFLDVLVGIGAFYRGDASLFFYPIRSIVRQIVLAGEFPYWNPMFGAGQPLAANPAYELFYPATWLTFLPGFVYVFQLVALLHLHVLTLSTYALLRSLGTRRPAACIGALSFGLGGFALSALHLYPILFSAAWMPLTCLLARRFLQRRDARSFALASSVFALQLLVGEPVTVLQTGLLLGLYALFRSTKRTLQERLRDVALVGLVSVAAFLVSAVQTIPMLDHYGDSVRSEGFDFEHVAYWSTSPARLAEAFYPGLFGSARPDGTRPYWGSGVLHRTGSFFPSIYPGLLMTVLTFAGIYARVRGWRLAAITIVISVLLALGEQTPLLRFLYDAGVADSLRFPEKLLILALFVASVFGAVALDRLLSGDDRVRRAAIAVSALSALIAAVAAAVMVLPDAEATFRNVWRLDPRLNVDAMFAASRMTWLFAIARGLLLAGALVFVTRMRRDAAGAMLLLFVIADLAPAASDVAPRTSLSFYKAMPSVLRRIDPDRSQYRILTLGNWSDSERNRGPYLRRRAEYYVLQKNALVGLTPAAWGIRTAAARDFDRTSLLPTSNFLAAANQLRALTPHWLNSVAAMSNVRYVGVYQPLDREVVRTGGDLVRVEPIRLIEGPAWPRYYFARSIVPTRDLSGFIEQVATGRHDLQSAFVDLEPFEPASGRVVRVEETSNRVRLEVDAAGRAFLVMSVTPHKYWSVTLDGVGVPSIVTNIGFQGVVVPGGRHVIEMRYRNPLIAAGGAISAATLLALGLAAIRARIRS